MNASRPVRTLIPVLATVLLAVSAATAQDRGGPPFDPEAAARFREMMRARGGEGGRESDRGRSNRGDDGGSEDWRERFRGGGGGGLWGGGGPWGGGRGRDGDDSGGGPRAWPGGEGMGWWGGGEGGRGWGGEGGGNSDGPNRGSSSSKSAGAEKKPRQRITLDLPESFVASDADFDGQLGLYEWKKAKRSVAAFRKIDGNGDGFLTPAELIRNGSEAAPAANIAATASADGSAPRTVNPQPPVDATPVAIDESLPEVKQARNFFGLLDSDHDGNVSSSEWNSSRQLKPLFEKAGIDLSSPMSEDQFVSHYVRIKSPKS